jgi:hypothetical protein
MSVEMGGGLPLDDVHGARIPVLASINQNFYIFKEFFKNFYRILVIPMMMLFLSCYFYRILVIPMMLFLQNSFYSYDIEK